MLRNSIRQELVLVVGRDPAVIAAASSALQRERFGVMSCSLRALNGRIRELQPDIVVLEASDQFAEAADACRGLRRQGATPLIVLGSVRAESAAILILDAGADDYVREPFGDIEFIARVNAVLRRSTPAHARRDGIAVGPLRVDEAEHAAFVDGIRMALSPTEFRLLAYLVRHPNRVVASGDLVTRVWGAPLAESRDLLRVTMSRLRRKIGADHHRDLHIHVIPRRGYRLAIEATSIGTGH